MTLPEDLALFPRCTTSVLKWLIASNPFLHKLDKFYVNLKTKDITIEVNRKHLKLIKIKIEDDAFEGIKNLIVFDDKDDK